MIEDIEYEQPVEIKFIPLESPVTQMTRPDNGPCNFTGCSEITETVEAGDVCSNEKDWMPLNDEENSKNSFEHPLPLITSTLPPPPTPPPTFSVIHKLI